MKVRPGDWLKVLGREALAGVALGLVVGVLGFARAYFASDEHALALALVVSISIVSVVMVGSLVGLALATSDPESRPRPCRELDTFHRLTERRHRLARLPRCRDGDAALMDQRSGAPIVSN